MATGPIRTHTTNTTKSSEVDRPLVDERRANDDRDYKDDLKSILDEDGRVQDKAAQDFFHRQMQNAAVAPVGRLAESDRQGTPAQLDEDSPEGWVSDGGPSLVDSKAAKSVNKFLADSEKQVEIRLKAAKEREENRRK